MKIQMTKLMKAFSMVGVEGFNSNCNCNVTGAVGTRAVGTGAVGTRAVGTGAVGTRAVGTGSVGTGAVGTGAVGTGAVGIEGSLD